MEYSNNGALLLNVIMSYIFEQKENLFKKIEHQSHSFTPLDLGLCFS